MSIEDDEGLFQFLKTYLSLSPDVTNHGRLDLSVSLRVTSEKAEQIALSVNGVPYEELKAQEVYKRLSSSSVMLFHDSTEFFHPYRFRETANLLKQISTDDEARVKAAQTSVNKVWTRVAKKSQQDMTAMLGRLKDKYELSLTIANTDMRDVPYRITLGTEDGGVELEKWGSGTQNRTRILMTLFQAKQVRDATTSSDKVTPIIIIEEPESYLHPSAQAEFGRTLRDLAEEFKIQVIVTTHSPYLLSLSDSEGNVLLSRKIERRRSRATEVVSTSGSNWVEPFCLALGISDSELSPWKDVLFSGRDAVLLVEGPTDKEYLTLLQDQSHGDKRLLFEGIIFPYGGKDTLKQKQLLRFIMSQFKQFILTYDLDAESEVLATLQHLGLERGKQFIAIGRKDAGKQAIEGLLPDEVLQSVYMENPDVVQKATAEGGTIAKDAKDTLKRLYLEKFRVTAKPRSSAYERFYSLAEQLNRMCTTLRAK